MLEADLWRSEAKVAALANPDQRSLMRYKRDEKGEIVAEERDEVPISKEEGAARWRNEMSLRFLSGGDEDFDYEDVDENEIYDDRDLMEREEEEKWFEEEEPQWMEKEDRAENGTIGELKGLSGQTGIQDF